MAESDLWATNANHALSLRLVGAPPPVDKAFAPDFTYQIGFGQEETIFGYSSLSILLTFTPSNLYTLVSVNFGAVNESTTAKIDDIPSILGEYLPSDFTLDADEFRKKVEEEEQGQFQPFGEKIAEYDVPVAAKKGKGSSSQGSKRSAPGASASRGSGAAGNSKVSSTETTSDHFEVYRTTWATPGWREFHRRMQFFALLYIEGASYIHEDEENWQWLTTWHSTTDAEGRTRYIFVGYTSLYKFWHYPSSSRLRLSQFLVLPPYHKQSHGTRLYQTAYSTALSVTSVTELTVEDPNEAFDRLRDTADLKRLLAPGGIIDQMKSEEGGMNAPLQRARSERWRLEAKIAKRQWSRLIEMIQLMELDPSDAAAIKAYRLQVKARLYRFNKDILIQLTLQERHAKLQETYESLLEAEYGDLVGVDVDPFLDGPGGEGDSDGDDDDNNEEEALDAVGSNSWADLLGARGAGDGGKRRKI